MISSVMRSVRRMSKSSGGCTKLCMMVVCSFLIVYTVWSMCIDKETASSSVFWVTDDKISSMRSNTTVSSVCEVHCPESQYSFYIRSGEGHKKRPIICFQGEMYMSEELKNIGRGINMVVVNVKTQETKFVKVFDTYQREVSLLRALKREIGFDDLILLTTYDDAFYNLHDAGRIWLAKYGSKLIHKVKFRESLIMIGMRGLEPGKAIEYHQVKGKTEEYGKGVEKAGCFSMPLGEQSSLAGSLAKTYQGSELMRGERFDNCGLVKTCPANTVAFSVTSGMGDRAFPSVCVDGFVRLGKGVNGAGRGFNVLTINPKTLETMQTIHVDSYDTDSTDLDFFIETLPVGTIVVVVVADEASKRVEQSTRDVFNNLGSGNIQNLRFRDIWFMVSQVGMKGFTVFEEIKYAPFGKEWPAPINQKFCIPKTIPSMLSVADPGYTRNDHRRQFCTKHEGYTEFCHAANVDDELESIGVYTQSLKEHAVFDTPIVLVPGMDHNAFANTLQTTLLQPGIKPDMVAVFWDEKLPEYRELANLFGFREYVIDSSNSYPEQVTKAMMKAKLAYPSASHFIVIEEDLLLAPDFLPFMAACLDAMTLDHSLAGASAWNPNGFEGMSGPPEQVYRVHEFPGLGFLIKQEMMSKLIHSMGRCCLHRAWFGWTAELGGGEMLMPAMSRVYRMPLFGAVAGSNLARQLFLKRRQTHLEVHPVRIDTKSLQANQYESSLKAQVEKATSLPVNTFDKCLEDSAAVSLQLPQHMQGSVVIFYQQSSSSDYKLLRKLCHCFGLVSFQGAPPKNLRNGLLRFSMADTEMFLVGTSSPYFIGERHNEVVMDPDYFKPQHS